MANIRNVSICQRKPPLFTDYMTTEVLQASHAMVIELRQFEELSALVDHDVYALCEPEIVPNQPNGNFPSGYYLCRVVR